MPFRGENLELIKSGNGYEAAKHGRQLEAVLRR
jgi:hypothetical protein